MIKKKNQVQKMLSPEETSLLQDVMAGLNTLLMSNNAGAMEEAVEGGGAQEVMMETEASPEPEIETNEEEEAQKEENEDELEKSNDGPTANDKAEDRLEDGTEISEDNLASVAKALIQMSRKKTVKKQKSSTSANEVAQIVLKALTPVINKIGTVEKDMNAMLEAIGFAGDVDTVEKAQNPMNEIQKSLSTPAPITNPDSMDIVKMIGQSVAQELLKEEQKESVVGGPKYSTANTEAHKSLGSAVIQRHKGV